jgi:hypothetical protein
LAAHPRAGGCDLAEKLLLSLVIKHVPSEVVATPAPLDPRRHLVKVCNPIRPRLLDPEALNQNPRAVLPPGLLDPDRHPVLVLQVTAIPKRPPNSLDPKRSFVFLLSVRLSSLEKRKVFVCDRLAVLEDLCKRSH